MIKRERNNVKRINDEDEDDNEQEPEKREVRSEKKEN